ncbi:MAG: prolipoprotein diacylglyceryl transferase [Methylocystaceae bacterium]
MYPELLHIGPVTIYSWGAMLALALLVIAFLLNRRFREEGINPDYALDLILLCVVAGIVGARLFYVVFYDWSYFVAHPREIFSFGSGAIAGLMWYGGFFGGAAAFYAYVRWRHLSFWAMADIFAPYLALGYALVRIGCFLNGCCYGVATNLPWGVVFPGVGDLHRHPTQLYSTMLNLLIFWGLLKLYPRRSYKGEVFLAYLGLYSLYRFIIEFFRENLVIGGVLTISQWIAMVMVLVTGGLYILLKKRSN